MEQIEFTETTALSVGTIVATTVPYGMNKAGSIGVVYNVELDNGIHFASILLQNGHDIGAFNEVEVETSLEVISIKELTYAFISPAKLQADYASGLFNEVFDDF